MAVDVLFELLQSALWGDELRTKTITKTGTELDEVLAVAEQQTVVPLVLQAMERAQVELSREGRRRMLIYTQKSVKHNRKLNQEIGALMTLLQQHGIDYVVVKGQVLASYYAHPVLRQGGDIDFYCDTKNFSKAHDIIRQEWDVEEHESDPGFHEHFSRHGIDFEMHYSLVHLHNRQKDAYWASSTSWVSMVLLPVS